MPHEACTLEKGYIYETSVFIDRYHNMASLQTNLQKSFLVRASVDALCRDGTDQISRERVQRGRLTRQGTRS